MESLGLTPAFWAGRRVFLTGHTGFKGAWLSFWLARAGAQVFGYALAPETTPSLFTIAGLERLLGGSTIADIRDRQALESAIEAAAPDVVIHMAAQPLVRRSYREPVETFATNVIGTVNLLDILRNRRKTQAIVVVTSDKCYENNENGTPFQEDDRLGGHDPYSASKACQEIAVAAMRASFFADGPLIATARAGNVLGGGDWAEDRLIPDLVRAAAARSAVQIRYPDAVRPWQFVLDPLAGYLRLAERLASGDRTCAKAWNFGPSSNNLVSVRTVANEFIDTLGGLTILEMQNRSVEHEARVLSLDASRAHAELGWRSRCDVSATIKETAGWYAAVASGTDPIDACDHSLAWYCQLNEMTNLHLEKKHQSTQRAAKRKNFASRQNN